MRLPGCARAASARVAVSAVAHRRIRRVQQYRRDAGREVAQVVKISETFRAYALTNAEIGSALASVDTNAVDAS